MCGIVGITSSKPVSSMILNSLRKLEYRGYDSSGIATLHEGTIHEIKSEGRVDALEKNLNKSNLYGNIGIGHVRDGQHMVFQVQLMHILIHLKMFLSYIME